jgi:predicted MPP superfamily phosphohydrolase
VAVLSHKRSWLEWCFDGLCIASIVGMYPRYIEPRLLCVSRHRLALPLLPQPLNGMRVLFFSDLHTNHYSSPHFLARVRRTIDRLSPDLILFGGDVLTYSQLPTPDLAKSFFNGLSAPLGVFACLGNHDYAEYSTIDRDGIAVGGRPNGKNPILQGIKRVFGSSRSYWQHPLTTPLPFHDALLRLYAEHNITVLNNETVHIGHGSQCINLTGLGDITSGHLAPSKAFEGALPHVPGIVFSHNPDAYRSLSCFPGDLFLFGHTHGGQVNLPLLWQRITPIVDTSFRSGLYMRDDRTVFVTRGVGATFPFRLFAPPQLVLFELVRGNRVLAEAPTKLLLESAGTPSFAARQALRSDESDQ